MRKRHFTLAQANSLLARVRPRLERMMQLSIHLRSSSDYHARGQAGESASASFDSARTNTLFPPGTPWMADPVVAAWQAPDPDAQRGLAACLYETLSQQLKGVEALGVEVKDLSIGLAVFPSYLDGSTEVFLSWTVAEAEIRSFYTPQNGYRQRKPVAGRRFTAVRNPSGQLRE